LWGAAAGTSADEGLVDRAAVATYADGLDDLERHLNGWPVERAAVACGIDASLIRDAAVAFGTASAAISAWTMGGNHSV
jgi:anaerobic selenocysteine-containing dehydrogenase